MKRICPECGPIFGRRIRGRLHHKGKVLFMPYLLTLTVDRRNFAGPEQAHRAIAGGRYIPRLMRLLGVKWWVCVLEFQGETGDGWPHWHLLIEMADVHGRLDLSRAWHLWRDKWHLGGLDLSVRKTDFKSTAHAINYITKYLIKFPANGWPVWVVNATHRIRFIMASRLVGPLVAKEKKPWEVPEEIESEQQQNESDSDSDTVVTERETLRPFGARAATCSTHSVILQRQRETIDPATGELRTAWKYMGTIPGNPSDVASHLSYLVEKQEDQGQRPRYVVTGSIARLLQESRQSEVLAEARRARVLDRSYHYFASEFARRLNARCPGAAAYAPFLSAAEIETIDLLDAPAVNVTHRWALE